MPEIPAAVGGRAGQNQIVAQYSIGYRQRLNSDSPTKNTRIISPLIATPTMAAARLSRRTHPVMLIISATGGVRSIVSPPRAEKGEPHPGLRTNISTITAGATSESHKPTRPTLQRGLSGEIRLDPIISTRMFWPPSQRHINGLADHLQRRKIELDFDGDRFAGQFFGHSP
ncbi:MAG: hypothetical protein HY360_03155 [Verrucomicrobia bacterium]|nr:hypothetical protein [Verrucomicrobiota bacterium]